MLDLQVSQAVEVASVLQGLFSHSVTLEYFQHVDEPIEQSLAQVEVASQSFLTSLHLYTFGQNIFLVVVLCTTPKQAI